MPKTLLDQLEILSKIFGAIAIPIVIAFFGWLIQKQIATDSLSKDYVQLAAGILKEPKKDGDELLRSWAVDLLNAHSSVKIGSPAAEGLRKGSLTLPASNFNSTYVDAIENKMLASAGGVVVTTDRNTKKNSSVIEIDHGNNWLTRYNFSAGIALVKRGDIVKKGQAIALLEQLADGQKIEFVFEVLHNNVLISPEAFFSRDLFRAQPPSKESNNR